MARLIPALTAVLLLAGATAPAAGQRDSRPAPVAASARDVAPGELDRALAEARPGDLLHLLPGVHPGPIVVRTPVRIQGSPGTVIVGDGDGTVITLAADDVELLGVEVRDSGSDLSSDDAAILLLESRRATVRDCMVQARAFGIYLREGGEHRITGNEIRGDRRLDPNRRGNAIHLWHSTDNEVVGNHVADARDGIYLSFAHDNRIVDNDGTGLRYGIHYMYSERNVLRRNRFVDGIGGIALMYSRGNRIVGNELDDNRDFGILFLQLEDSEVVDNRVAGNGRGLVLQNSAANRVLDNEVNGNGVGVYLTGGAEGNLLAGNLFVRNLVQAYRDHAGDNTWSTRGRGNYWSDYVGFDWDGDGVGEMPYRLQTAASALMARRPAARWFRMSPAIALLDWWEGRLVGASPAGGLDRHPLVGPTELPEGGS